MTVNTRREVRRKMEFAKRIVAKLQVLHYLHYSFISVLCKFKQLKVSFFSHFIMLVPCCNYNLAVTEPMLSYSFFVFRGPPIWFSRNNYGRGVRVYIPFFHLSLSPFTFWDSFWWGFILLLIYMWPCIIFKSLSAFLVLNIKGSLTVQVKLSSCDCCVHVVRIHIYGQFSTT